MDKQELTSLVVKSLWSLLGMHNPALKAASVIGMGISEKLIGARKVRSLDELIDSVANAVADDITAVISEYRNPDVRTSAAADFADALSTSGVTIDLLVNLHLDPSALGEHIASRWESRLVSEERQGMRQAMVQSFSSRLIEALALFPNLQIVVFQRLLQRQSEIADQLAEVIALLQEQRP
jgi:hypothetical protein